MKLTHWVAIQDETHFTTLREIAMGRNAERQAALDAEKYRPSPPEPRDPLPGAPEAGEGRWWRDVVYEREKIP